MAVLKDDRVIYRDALGLARGPAGGAAVAITPETRFDVASLTKQFTATAVLMLVDRGRIALDDPVTRWLPELARRERPGKPVRVRDLLWMTSGLCDFDWTGKDFLPRRPERVTDDDAVRFVAGRAAEAEPGERFAYSNADYVLLAALVERVSGVPFADWLAREIFAPLGMTRTVQVDDRGGPPFDAARGHERRGDRWVELAAPLSLTGAFHVFSTVDDLARWDAALADGRLFRDRTMERQEWVAGRLARGGRTRYAMGWNLKTHLGRRLAWHTGRWPGYRAYIGRYLDEGLTVIVLSNDHHLECGILGGRIAALALVDNRVTYRSR